MSLQCIAHDFAWAAAFELLDAFRPVIRPEEVHFYFTRAFERVNAAIAEAIIAHDRERQRLNGARQEEAS